MTHSTTEFLTAKIDKLNLTPSQKKAVCHKDGALLVIAGPGSGKTRVITTRIAALVESGVHPSNICAITFTNKAAQQMQQRVFQISPFKGMQISTFHSLCVRLLRRYGQAAGIKSNFTIYDTADQRRDMKEAVKSCDLDTSNFSPARMLEGVSRLKNNLVEPDEFKKEADDFFSEKLAAIYARYQQMLEVKNALDFDDLLMKTAIILRDNDDIRREVSSRFRYLLIDEYQDTNHCQYAIAKYIASEHSNICATGDPDQSIYRWRGADINNILNFERDYPDAEVVKLEENFRSTPDILKAADTLIANNVSRKPKNLIPVKESGKQVDINVYGDDKTEALQVAEKVKELKSRGVRLSEVAVFYRVNSMSRMLEEAFIKNKVPYQIVRGVEFYARKEIRDILAYLKVLVNPDDELSLVRIINTPTRGIGKTTIERCRVYAEIKNMTLYQALLEAENIKVISPARIKRIKDFINMLEEFKKQIDTPVSPQIKNIIEKSGLLEFFQKSEDGESAVENLYELVNSSADYDKQNDNPNLLDFVQQISLFSDADAYDESSERTALMTLHAAKGLEFDYVFIIGLEEGVLPHERSMDEDAQIEEERRLLFVGTTRAREYLNISYAEYRTFRGQFLRTIPSRFLQELGIDIEGNLDNNQSVSRDVNIPSPEESRSGKNKEFEKGELVRHPKFGFGRVVKFSALGANSVIKIKFNSGHTKVLMLKYAKLTKVEN